MDDSKFISNNVTHFVNISIYMLCLAYIGYNLWNSIEKNILKGVESGFVHMLTIGGITNILLLYSIFILATHTRNIMKRISPLMTMLDMPSFFCGQDVYSIIFSFVTQFIFVIFIYHIYYTVRKSIN